MILTKSLFRRGLCCPKKLWMSVFQSELLPAVSPDAMAEGARVGALARSFYGVRDTISLGKPETMARETGRLLSELSEGRWVAEASFLWEDFFCSVDLLSRNDKGGWEILEVKSSTAPKDFEELLKKKEEDLWDLSFQTMILTKLGYSVSKAKLLYLDGSYERGEELDLSRLFTGLDVTEEVTARLSKTEAQARTMAEILAKPSCPLGEIDHACFAFGECDFFPHCSAHLPIPHVFQVSGMTKPKKVDFFQQGIVTFQDLWEHGKMTANQKVQVEHEVMEIEESIDVQKLRDFLSSFSHPLYFLDFETYNPAIPPHPCTKPYEQIPFQYSLHGQEKEGAAIFHREFLGEPEEDPRRALAETLCEDIPMDVSILAYNMSFEKARLRALAKLFPDLSEHLMNIHDHLLDLMLPFREKTVYFRSMAGSYSIKYVLPALYPDEPTLNYKNLEGVHNGSEAMQTYARLPEMTKEERERARHHLLEYCKLDTFALVKVLEKLRALAEV